jgi:hypothetical protein
MATHFFTKKSDVAELADTLDSKFHLRPFQRLPPTSGITHITSVITGQRPFLGGLNSLRFPTPTLAQKVAQSRRSQGMIGRIGRAGRGGMVEALARGDGGEVELREDFLGVIVRRDSLMGRAGFGSMAEHEKHGEQASLHTAVSYGIRTHPGWCGGGRERGLAERRGGMANEVDEALPVRALVVCQHGGRADCHPVDGHAGRLPERV